MSDDPNQALNRLATQVKPVQPYKPVTAREVKYYFCPNLHHAMIRTDGKKLSFIWGVYATQDKNDQKYLDDEIDGGNFYVQYATDAQIEEYRMRVDPKGTLAERLRPEIHAQVDHEVKMKLKQKLLAQRKAGENQLTDEQIDSLLDISTVQEEQMALDTRRVAGAGGRDVDNSGPGFVSGTGVVKGLDKLKELAAGNSQGPANFQSSIVNSNSSENKPDSNS